MKSRKAILLSILLMSLLSLVSLMGCSKEMQANSQLSGNKSEINSDWQLESIGGVKSAPSCTAEHNGCGPNNGFFNAIPEWLRNGSLEKACNCHDLCYAYGESTYGMDRTACDKKFSKDMTKLCERKFGSWNPLRYACKAQALIYYGAVRAGGSMAWAPKTEHCYYESYVSCR